jgi:molybdopterin converting factor small subunit
MKPGAARVTIELYGIARLRAGCTSLEVSARDVAEALGALVQRCPRLEPEVVRAGLLREGFLANRNGECFLRDPSSLLAEGDTLLIVGSQAGG